VGHEPEAVLRGHRDYHARLKHTGDEHGARRAERVPFGLDFQKRRPTPSSKDPAKALPLLFDAMTKNGGR
jgi:hypothetical protein